MSLVVVLLVAGAVFIYVRASRKARQAWLARLDLPGLWHWQQGEGELALSGQLSKGTFVLRDGQTESSGTWRVDGTKIVLRGQDFEQVLDVHFFKAGNIGLEDEKGQRRVYVKETSNVVPLKRH
ncbi:MAG: hypothetical protein RIC89_07640 [Pseudomonadales bacterium]